MQLEPDAEQIRLFVDALFRYASPTTFVSLRAFYEGAGPFQPNLWPVKMSGGPEFLVEAAIDMARRAAQDPKPVVFAPPIVTLTNGAQAREIDLAEGLELLVECDQRPQAAKAMLEGLLGPVTVAVRSGGTWTDPQTGEITDKIHLHWRLEVPARGADQLAKLKRARDLATRMVGGDPSSIPAVHPIRWPGSWHRKGEPRMCEIATMDAGQGIDLALALAALEAAVKDLPRQHVNGHAPGSGEPASWDELFADIKAGENYHDANTRLSAKLIKAGMSAAAATKLQQGAMEASTGPRDERWQSRYDDIARGVRTAQEKFAGTTAAAAGLDIITAADVAMREVIWMWPDRYALGALGLLAGLPDEGKGQVFAYMAARVTRGGEWPCGEGTAPQGSVILLTGEDNLANTVVPRLAAAGADLAKVHIIRMVDIGNGKGKRMFSLVDDLELLRKKIAEIGDVVMVQIDPVTAYLGVKKVDSFRTTDVRAVLTPIVSLAEETKVAMLGMLHFNKKTDVTNALLRISDSLAFGATARHVYAIVDDGDHDRKLMVKGKNNLARKGQKALAYEFAEKEVGKDVETGNPIIAPYVVWQAEPVDVTATEAMTATNENKSPGARSEAKEFLREYLADEPMPSKAVEEAADAHGISDMTLRRAKTELRIRVAKRGFGNDGEWFCELPPKGDQRDGFDR